MVEMVVGCFFFLLSFLLGEKTREGWGVGWLERVATSGLGLSPVLISFVIHPPLLSLTF